MGSTLKIPLTRSNLARFTWSVSCLCTIIFFIWTKTFHFTACCLACRITVSEIELNLQLSSIDYFFIIDWFPETMMICFTVCHLIGVSSCCTNPILYGFLNPNLCKVYQNFYDEAEVGSWTFNDSIYRVSQKKSSWGK